MLQVDHGFQVVLSDHHYPRFQVLEMVRAHPVFLPLLAYLVPQVFQGDPSFQILLLIQLHLWLPLDPLNLSDQVVQALLVHQQVQDFLGTPCHQ